MQQKDQTRDNNSGFNKLIFGFALPFEVIATIKNTESFLWLQFLRKELCMDWVVEVYLGNELIDDTSTLRLSDKANIPACETEAA